MTKKQIKIKLIRSTAGASRRQKETVRGLGLTHTNQIRSLADTDASRGMVRKVSHLVTIIEQ